MAFQIVEILDSQSKSILAKLSHCDNQVTVIIPNKELEDIVVGKSFQAEMDYEKILSWKVISDLDDTESCIWQEKDGIHLLGRVHNIVDLGNHKAMIDVYMQCGPEFFAVNSEAIDNEIPNRNAGLEIIVSNLYIYPTS